MSKGTEGVFENKTFSINKRADLVHFDTYNLHRKERVFVINI